MTKQQATTVATDELLQEWHEQCLKLLHRVGMSTGHLAWSTASTLINQDALQGKEVFRIDGLE